VARARPTGERDRPGRAGLGHRVRGVLPDPTREARLGAWASRQSEPVGSREELDAAFGAAAARLGEGEIPLPPHWGGYRLVPDAFEFWKGREHRLHDRFRYTRMDGRWRIERLYP